MGHRFEKGGAPLRPRAEKCPTSRRNRAPLRSNCRPTSRRNQCPTSPGIRSEEPNALPQKIWQGYRFAENHHQIMSIHHEEAGCLASGVTTFPRTYTGDRRARPALTFAACSAVRPVGAPAGRTARPGGGFARAVGRCRANRLFRPLSANRRASADPPPVPAADVRRRVARGNAVIRGASPRTGGRPGRGCRVGGGERVSSPCPPQASVTPAGAVQDGPIPATHRSSASSRWPAAPAPTPAEAARAGGRRNCQSRGSPPAPGGSYQNFSRSSTQARRGAPGAKNVALSAG